jgi:hypothetical protein
MVAYRLCIAAVLNETPHKAARCKLLQLFDVAIPLSTWHFQTNYARDGEKSLPKQLIHSCDDRWRELFFSL